MTEVSERFFLCYPRGSGTSHQSFRERGGVFSVRGLFISDLTNGLVFVGGVIGQCAVV